MNQELDKIHPETFNIIIMSYNDVYLMFTKTIHLVIIMCCLITKFSIHFLYLSLQLQSIYIIYVSGDK